MGHFIYFWKMDGLLLGYTTVVFVKKYHIPQGNTVGYCLYIKEKDKKKIKIHY
jgi:hypothetical protein